VPNHVTLGKKKETLSVPKASRVQFYVTQCIITIYEPRAL